jgi:nucleoside-diphosphate-sugar epimerase
MQRVLIAGCGYLGQAIAGRFQAAGWEVVGWRRTGNSEPQSRAKPYRIEAVDISNSGQVSSYDANFDAVIHCASTRGGDLDAYRKVYLVGIGNLLDRFSRSTILLTSSTSVYGQQNGELVTENSPAQPEHHNGQVLREAEQLVVERGGIVARLAGIYGPGRAFLLRSFLNGQAVIDPTRNRFVNQIHRDDAADAVFFLVERTGLREGIYNVVDDQPILEADCYRWLADKLARPLPPIGKSRPTGKRGHTNKRVSNAKLKSLGWNPRFPSFEKGIEQSVLPSSSW